MTCFLCEYSLDLETPKKSWSRYFNLVLGEPSCPSSDGVLCNLDSKWHSNGKSKKRREELWIFQCQVKAAKNRPWQSVWKPWGLSATKIVWINFFGLFFFTAPTRILQRPAALLDSLTRKASLYIHKTYVLLKGYDKEGRQAFVVGRAAIQPDKISWSVIRLQRNWGIMIIMELLAICRVWRWWVMQSFNNLRCTKIFCYHNAGNLAFIIFLAISVIEVAW